MHSDAKATNTIELLVAHVAFAGSSHSEPGTLMGCIAAVATSSGEGSVGLH